MADYWKENADYVREAGGEDYVCYEEGFYYCLECGEPIYRGDWTPDEFAEFMCPICGWEGD